MYSTDQMQSIRQTHLPSHINSFVTLYKPCINMYLPQCTSVFASSCKCKLHEPYTLHLICTVCLLLVSYICECVKLLYGIVKFLRRGREGKSQGSLPRNETLYMYKLYVYKCVWTCTLLL